MPIDLSKYPPNWKEISFAVKEAASWNCQQCGRPCKKPTETWDDLKYRLARKSKKLYQECVEKKIRFVLTTAHLDHDTQNNRLNNLAAYCSACHLRYDSKHHAKNAAKTRAKTKATSLIKPKAKPKRKLKSKVNK